MQVKDVWRNRNFILLLALTLGFLWAEGAEWTVHMVIPALALVMLVSTIEVPDTIFRSPRKLLTPTMVGIAINYAVLGVLILILNNLVIHDDPTWTGFVILAAVPPAVKTIAFTYSLGGDTTFSLFGTIGCYLVALIMTPLMILAFLGSILLDPGKPFIIMIEVIIIPLCVSRVLLWTKTAERMKPVRGVITNWSFFVIVYTSVALNRGVFLSSPLSLLPIAVIATVCTFLLGSLIGGLAAFLRIDSKTRTSLILLGTLKNDSIAVGLALSLFDQRTAVPATVFVVFMIVYLIWLGFNTRH